MSATHKGNWLTYTMSHKGWQHFHDGLKSHMDLTFKMLGLHTILYSTIHNRHTSKLTSVRDTLGQLATNLQHAPQGLALFWCESRMHVMSKTLGLQGSTVQPVKDTLFVVRVLKVTCMWCLRHWMCKLLPTEVTSMSITHSFPRRVVKDWAFWGAMIEWYSWRMSAV